MVAEAINQFALESPVVAFVGVDHGVQWGARRFASANASSLHCRDGKAGGEDRRRRHGRTYRPNVA